MARNATKSAEDEARRAMAFQRQVNTEMARAEHARAMELEMENAAMEEAWWDDDDADTLGDEDDDDDLDSMSAEHLSDDNEEED